MSSCTADPSWTLAWRLRREQFFVSLVAIPLCGRYLERVWSYTELLKFAFVVILASNIISVGFSWIVYFLLNDVKSMCVRLRSGSGRRRLHRGLT